VEPLPSVASPERAASLQGSVFETEWCFSYSGFSWPYWVVRSRLWYDVLSVCRLSVTFCIVAKRYVVEGRRWVALDRALLSSYRLSIVTMSLTAAVWPQLVNKQVTTFTFWAQATTCSKHRTRTVMDAGCECAPWVRSANPSRQLGSCWLRHELRKFVVTNQRRRCVFLPSFLQLLSSWWVILHNIPIP